MPYREEQFVNDEIYHIILKGIDDNLIFKDINDYYRGIFSIYEFNNKNLVTIQQRRKVRTRIKKEMETDRNPVPIADERDKLVEVLAFCFMPNHIHLLLRQLKDNGISAFMMKVAGGYSRYFNIKYERRGHLFQGVFNSVHIENDGQLKTVFVYIHTNPISLIEPKWKETGIKNQERIIKFLEEEYRWSSYFDFIGKNNFPSVTGRNFILDIINGLEGCREEVNSWVKYKGEIKEFSELSLE